MIHLKNEGWVQDEKTVFIFDEAQRSYRDEKLWHIFFKSIHDFKNCRVIIFASYGSPTSLFTDGGTPIPIINAKKITLRAIEHDDKLPAAGLLFTRTELDDLVKRYSPPPLAFHQSFFDDLFHLTQGHVGAITDFIKVILAHDVGPLIDLSNNLTSFSVVS